MENADIISMSSFPFLLGILIETDFHESVIIRTLSFVIKVETTTFLLFVVIKVVVIVVFVRVGLLFVMRLPVSCMISLYVASYR